MRDLLFSVLHDAGVSRILRSLRIRNREISVLMFHRISDERDILWPPLPVRTFRRLMEELASRACVIPLEALENLTEYPDKPLVTISFDDGYLDFIDQALPVLTDLGLPACHHVCPGLVDEGIPPWTQLLSKFVQGSGTEILRLPNGTVLRRGQEMREVQYLQICTELLTLDDDVREAWIAELRHQIPEASITRLMNWDQIRACAKAGIHIGSHGKRHLNLSKVSDKRILDDEIRDSRRRITEEVGVEPATFAFPNGQYNSLSLRIVRESGYRVALLCDDLAATLDIGGGSGWRILPRINIARHNWKEENLRLLGFHQRLKSFVSGRSYCFSSPVE